MFTTKIKEINIESIFYKSLIILLISSLGIAKGQAQNAVDIQKDIDQQVWKPFKKAFETLDAIALNNLYADRVLRVTPGGIDTDEAFKKMNVVRFGKNKDEGTVIKLEFWFDERKTNTNTSYEVGFFKITSLTEAVKNITYGQFHIVLEKIDNQWKITQDWDTSQVNGKRIGAEDFDRKPSQF